MKLRVIATALAVSLPAVALSACGGESPPEVTSAPTTDNGYVEKSWVRVTTLKGSASKTSAPFGLQGGGQKLSVTVRGEGTLLAAFFVEAANVDVEKVGGVPVATAGRSRKDSVQFSRVEGRHRISVQSAGCRWSVTLWERR